MERKGHGQFGLVKTVEDYDQVIAYLETNFEEVNGEDFYRDIFPDNENSGEKRNDFTKPNAIYLYYDERRKRMRRRIMLADTWEEDYMSYVEQNPFTLCSGLTFRGMTNKLAKAQQMNAMIFDLDRVGYAEVKTLFLRRLNRSPKVLRSMPQPTYVVASGSGLHLYYVFTIPVDLYPNIKVQAKRLKHDLTFRLWDYKSTSQAKDIQYQGIAQSFRMPGSVNDKYGTEVRAFKTGEKIPFTILNDYADCEDDKVDLQRPYRPTMMRLAEAKERYPEWYQHRIVEKQKPGHWHIKRDLYDWWKRQINKVRGGHRYFFLMCLSIYAAKCDISRAELRDDMRKLFDVLKDIDNEGDPFTPADVSSAMEMYDKEYYCFTINDIEKLSGIPIQRNRRNGRNQENHLRMARLIRDEINGRKNTWREGNGRKSKAQLVYDYRCRYPAAGVSAVAKRLGINRGTVAKWWTWAPDGKAPIPAPEDFFRLAKHDS